MTLSAAVRVVEYAASRTATPLAEFSEPVLQPRVGEYIVLPSPLKAGQTERYRVLSVEHHFNGVTMVCVVIVERLGL